MRPLQNEERLRVGPLDEHFELRGLLLAHGDEQHHFFRARVAAVAAEHRHAASELLLDLAGELGVINIQ